MSLNLNNQILALRQKGQSGILLGEIFDQLVRSFNTLTNAVTALVTASSSTVSPLYYTITPFGGNAPVELFNGLNQRVVLSASAVNVTPPIWTGGFIVAGVSFTLYIDQPASGDCATPTFTGGAGGFASDTASELVSPDPNTRTSVHFTFHGSVWVRDSWKTGLAIS